MDNSENKKQDTLHSNINPAIAIFLGVTGVFILYQLVGGITMLAIFGMDLKNVDFNALRLFQIASQFLFILLPAIFLSKFFFNDVNSVMRIKKTTLPEIGLFTAGILLVTVLAVDLQALQDIAFKKLIDFFPALNSFKVFLDEINAMMEESYKKLLTANSVFEFILVVFTVAVTPAICEEFFFRGFVLKGFEFKVKPLYAAMFTAIIFSFYHMNFYGFLALFGIGFYLGYAAYQSGSILVPVILHFINNFMAVVLFTIFKDEEFVNSTGAFQEPWIHLLRFTILLLIFISLIIFIRKFYSTNNNQQEVI